MAIGPLKRDQATNKPARADDDIRRVLCGPETYSKDRVRNLLDLLCTALSDEEFWRIFQIGWCECDDTWQWRGDLLTFLREAGAAEPYLQGTDRAFYEALPDPLTIHRGCSRPRVRGLAWTTDRAIAAGFARGHRGIPVPKAVVATAIVPKSAIFIVLTDRQESEVVVNWRRLRQLSVSPAAATVSRP